MEKSVLKVGKLVHFTSIFYGEEVSLGIYLALRDYEFYVEEGTYSLCGWIKQSPTVFIEYLVEYGVLALVDIDTITLSDD